MNDRLSRIDQVNDCSQRLIRMQSALEKLNPRESPAQWMCELVARDLTRLPLPGGGQTLVRWQALATVAAFDLSLAKLYEGHTDALAILAELESDSGKKSGQISAQVAEPANLEHAGGDTDAHCTVWGVWAAESARAKLVCEPAHTGSHSRLLKLHGTKTWCSGAACVSHGLLTAWGVDGSGPHLVRVDMNQAGVQVRSGGWRAVGMEGSASVDVTFTGATAHAVGGVGAYLERPGFSHGGAGVAACWYGGALSLGRALQRSLQQTPAAQRSPFRLAALGKVDASLHVTANLLREAAHWIDAHPAEDAQIVATRVRLGAEACARHVLDEAGRALGAAAYCQDAAFARAAADLPVYIRQCHGERDFAQLGSWASHEVPASWSL